MWGSLQDAILLTAEITWIGYIAMLVIFVKLYPHEKSGVIALVAWCITDLVSTVGSPALYTAVAEGRIAFGGWYLCFVILNTVSILAISVLHRSNNLFYSPVALNVCRVLLLMSVFHTIRLVDRMLIDVFSEVYRLGLMSLKFLVFYLVYSSSKTIQRSVA